MFKIRNRVLRVLAGLVVIGVVSTAAVGFLYGIGYLVKLLCLRFFFVAYVVGGSCGGDPFSWAISVFFVPAGILYIAWVIGDVYFKPKA